MSNHEPGSTENIQAEIATIQRDPTVSTWLRQTLDASLRRDPLDACKDAQVLADLLNRRADALLGVAGLQEPSPAEQGKGRI